jgi:hypothetical protein
MSETEYIEQLKNRMYVLEKIIGFYEEKLVESNLPKFRRMSTQSVAVQTSIDKPQQTTPPDKIEESLIFPLSQKCIYCDKYVLAGEADPEFQTFLAHKHCIPN